MPRLPNQLVSPLLMKTARNRIHEVTISPKTKNNTCNRYRFDQPCGRIATMF